MTRYYTDDLQPDDQISAEEAIADMIWDAQERAMAQFVTRQNRLLTEDTCAQLSRDILLEIVSRFAPELVLDDDDPHEHFPGVDAPHGYTGPDWEPEA